MRSKSSDRSEFAKLLDITAVLMLALCLYAAFTQHAHAKSFSSSEDFVQKAAVGGNFEIQSSQLALQRTKNDSVRTFAQHMIDDHSQANSQLQAALPNSSAAGVNLNQGLDKPHQKMLDKLKADSDSDFDKDYVNEQKKAHKEANDLFSDYAKSGDDDSLKSFASQTLPTIKEHRKMLYQLTI